MALEEVGATILFVLYLPHQDVRLDGCPLKWKAFKQERYLKKTREKQKDLTGQREPRWGHKLSRKQALHVGPRETGLAQSNMHLSVSCSFLPLSWTEPDGKCGERQTDPQDRGPGTHLPGGLSDSAVTGWSQ